jgi:hypothetical protein
MSKNENRNKQFERLKMRLSMRPDCGQSPPSPWGREYALAVAVDATGSTRPKAGIGHIEMVALKRPRASYDNFPSTTT